MSYTKLSATQIFDGYKFLGSNAVLIIKQTSHGKVVEEITTIDNAGDNVIHIDGIVSPGFINAHCHLELSYMHKKIPQQTGMVDFILAVLKGRSTPLEEIQQAITNAELAMVQCGIVAVGDICNTANTIVQKTKSNINYTNFIELSGFVPAVAQQKYNEGLQLVHTFVQHNLTATIVPHAPYSVSNNLFHLINAQHSAVSTIHYNESQAEREFVEHKSGDMLRLYNTLGISVANCIANDSKPTNLTPYINPNAQSQLLVHNVITNEKEIADLKLKMKNIAYVLCPNANLYIGNGLPNVSILHQLGVTICLGTDSLASNTQLNISAEIKTLRKHFPNIPLATMLQWATSNGAKALQINDQFGSFEKGKSGKYAVFQH